jgi:DNA-binding GntR family transcriptional regulator
VSDDGLRVTAVAAPVREQVLRRLRDAIIGGRFKPGDRLIERELVELTSVSRTSVREALRQLETEGLVVMVPSKGPVVAVLTEQTAKEIYAVRAVLEGYAARQFALHASEEQRRGLADSVDFMDAIVREGTTGGIIREKENFYRILFAGAQNQVAWSLFQSLYSRIAVLRSTTLSEPSRPPETIAELRQILEAIEARDGALAEEVTLKHVEKAAAVALQLISSSRA